MHTWHVAAAMALLCNAAAGWQVPVVGGDPRWLREAEKKHARVALVALPSLAAIAAATHANPVPWLSAQPADVQLTFYAAAGIVESATSVPRVAWGDGWTLRDGAVPGQLFSDTPPRTTPSVLDAAEDAAGRVAMLAVAGIMASSAAGAFG